MASLSGLVLCILVVVTKGSPLTKTFSWCEGQFCFHSNGLVVPRALEQAQKECKEMKQDSWPLEIYSQEVQNSVMKYISQFDVLKRKNVLLNLRRVDNPNWKWIGGKIYKDELSDAALKVRIFNKEGPFSTLRNLPLRGIFGDTYTTTKLENFICSYPFACGSNKTATTVNNVCYVKYNNKTDWDRDSGFNWFEACNFCYKSGGQLAVFDKMSAEVLQKKFLHFTTNWNNYWVGLAKSYWSWQQRPESISNFTNWYNGYPYPTYMSQDPRKITSYFDFYDGGIWMDSDKDVELGLICMTDQTAARDTSNNNNNKTR